MKHIGLMILLFTILGGCSTTSAPRNAVLSFGQAVDRFGRIGEEEVVAMRKEIIGMNRLSVVLGHIDPASLPYDEQARPNVIADRVAACKVLRFYGDLLLRLSSDDRSPYISRSATILLDSLKIALHSEPSSDQKMAVETILEFNTSTWTPKKREIAIRSIINSNTCSIDALTQFLASDFESGATSTSLLVSYEKTACHLQKLAMNIIEAGEEYELSERQMAVDAFFTAQTARVRAQELGGMIRTGYLDLAVVNTEFARHAEGGTLSQIDFSEFSRKLNSISAMQRTLND